MRIVPISELDVFFQGYTCSKASSPKETEQYNCKNYLFEFCKDSLKEFILNQRQGKILGHYSQLTPLRFLKVVSEGGGKLGLIPLILILLGILRAQNVSKSNKIFSQSF